MGNQTNGAKNSQQTWANLEGWTRRAKTKKKKLQSVPVLSAVMYMGRNVSWAIVETRPFVDMQRIRAFALSATRILPARSIVTPTGVSNCANDTDESRQPRTDPATVTTLGGLWPLSMSESTQIGPPAQKTPPTAIRPGSAAHPTQSAVCCRTENATVYRCGQLFFFFFLQRNSTIGALWVMLNSVMPSFIPDLQPGDVELRV
jgi:hypothetical protein